METGLFKKQPRQLLRERQRLARLKSQMDTQQDLDGRKRRQIIFLRFYENRWICELTAGWLRPSRSPAFDRLPVSEIHNSAHDLHRNVQMLMPLMHWGSPELAKNPARTLQSTCREYSLTHNATRQATHRALHGHRRHDTARAGTPPSSVVQARSSKTHPELTSDLPHITTDFRFPFSANLANLLKGAAICRLLGTYWSGRQAFAWSGSPQIETCRPISTT
jgi:hypothetical protein